MMTLASQSESDDDRSDEESGRYRYFLQRVGAQPNLLKEHEVNPLRQLLHDEYNPQTLEGIHDHISRIEKRLVQLERNMTRHGRNFDRNKKLSNNQKYDYERTKKYEDIESTRKFKQNEKNVTVLYSRCWTMPQLKLVRPGCGASPKHYVGSAVGNDSPCADSKRVVRPLRMKGGDCATKRHFYEGENNQQGAQEQNVTCMMAKTIRHSCCCQCSENLRLRPIEQVKKSWCCRKFRVHYPRLVWKRRKNQSDEKKSKCQSNKRPNVSKHPARANPSRRVEENPERPFATTPKVKKQKPVAAVQPQPAAYIEGRYYDDEYFADDTVRTAIVGSGAASKQTEAGNVHTGKHSKPAKESRQPPNSKLTDTIQLPPSISMDESVDELIKQIGCDKATSTTHEILLQDREALKVEELNPNANISSHGEACDCAACSYWKVIGSVRNMTGKPLVPSANDCRESAAVRQKSHQDHINGCKCALCVSKDTDFSHSHENNPRRDHFRQLERADEDGDPYTIEQLLAIKTINHGERCQCNVCNQRRRIETLKRKLNEEIESTEYFLINEDSLNESNVSRLMRKDSDVSVTSSKKESQRDDPDLLNDYAADTDEHGAEARWRRMSDELLGNSGKRKGKDYDKRYSKAEKRRCRRWSSTSSQSRKHERLTNQAAVGYRKRTNSRSSAGSDRSRCSRRSFNMCNCRYCKAANEKNLHVYQSRHKHKDYDALYKRANKYGHGEYDHMLKSDKPSVADSFPATLKNQKGNPIQMGTRKKKDDWKQPEEHSTLDDDVLSSTGCEASGSGGCQLKLDPWKDFRQIGLSQDLPDERERSGKSERILKKVTGWNARNLDEKKQRGRSSDTSEREPKNDGGCESKTGNNLNYRFVPSFNSRLESRMDPKADAVPRSGRQMSDRMKWRDDNASGDLQSRSEPEWSS